MNEEQQKICDKLSAMVIDSFPDKITAPTLAATLMTIAEAYAHCPRCAAEVLLDCGQAFHALLDMQDEACTAVIH